MPSLLGLPFLGKEPSIPNLWIGLWMGTTPLRSARGRLAGTGLEGEKGLSETCKGRESNKQAQACIYLAAL